MLRLLSCPGESKIAWTAEYLGYKLQHTEAKGKQTNVRSLILTNFSAQWGAWTILNTEALIDLCFVTISNHVIFNLPEVASHLWTAGGCLAAKRIPLAALWLRALLADVLSFWKLVYEFLLFWSTGCSALQRRCAASVKVGLLMCLRGWQGRRQHHRGRRMGLQELSEGSSSTRKTYSTTRAQSLGPYRAPPPFSPKLLPRQSAPGLTHRAYEPFDEYEMMNAHLMPGSPIVDQALRTRWPSRVEMLDA